MASYNINRELDYRSRPLTHGRRAELYQLLDEWYEMDRAMPAGGFTDLCELYQCHPRDMRAAIDLYRRLKARKRGRRSYRPSVPAVTAEIQLTDWDAVARLRRFTDGCIEAPTRRG